MKQLLFEHQIRLYGHATEKGKHYVIPPVAQPRAFWGDLFLWAMDERNGVGLLFQTGGSYRVEHRETGVVVSFDAEYRTERFEAYPSCDFWGNRFCITVDGSHELERAMAKFYWKSILNQCAERTFMRRKKRLREGYVLSTLQTDFYAGTYPAVDHEFHVRGRLAMGDQFDLQLVRRMLELQLRLMRTDWRRQYRTPCSLQPNGRREYRVYRKSLDGQTKAIMFLLTGILELVEELYSYYCLTKEASFVREHLATLERGLRFVEKHIDGQGRLWADVYYEDQVMKDGANAQAQAFAVNAFRLMARLERIVGQGAQAERYEALAEKLRENYVRPVPDGYWDAQTGHYVDWIDRQGRVHDHIHLLSNALSVTFALNEPAQDAAVNAMIEQNDAVFQKFPSFVAARIEEYTPSEIGSGGPYDLCAAGRYWCHDAKYRRKRGNAAMLRQQLERVAHQAEMDHFEMGERYDMNYIYYNTGADGTRNWHGSPRYYEYPNVFLDVLVHDFLGFLPDEEAQLCIAPCCTAQVEATMESFGLSYAFHGSAFTLRNLSGTAKRVRVDLSRLGFPQAPALYTLRPGEELTLAA